MNRIVKILLVLSFVLINANYLMACRCDEPGTVEEVFKHTPLVIHGEVIDIKYVSPASTMNPEMVAQIKKDLNDDKRMGFLESSFIIEVTVKVLRQYKGNLSEDTTTIYTTRTGASCGYTEFEVGQKFIIYASSYSFTYDFFVPNRQNNLNLRKQGTYWTNHCTRTRYSNEVELSELDKICEQKND